MFMIQLLGSDVYIMIMVTNEITMSACHTNIFEADNIKTLPKCNFTFCFPFFVSLWAMGSTGDSVDYWLCRCTVNMYQGETGVPTCANSLDTNWVKL